MPSFPGFWGFVLGTPPAPENARINGVRFARIQWSQVSFGISFPGGFACSQKMDGCQKRSDGSQTRDYPPIYHLPPGMGLWISG